MTMYDVTLSTRTSRRRMMPTAAKSPLAGLLREVAAARPDAEALVEVQAGRIQGRRLDLCGDAGRCRAAGHGALHPVCAR